MHLVSGPFALLLLSFLSPIFASPIDPSDSLATKTTENTLDPSLTLGASGAAGSYYCVSPLDHPDWAGPIEFSDCIPALDALRDRLGSFTGYWKLWSARYGAKPWFGNPLQLPFGAISRSCTLVLRFGRDFGSTVLPKDGGYFDPSRLPSEGLLSSNILLAPLRLDLVPRCGGGEGQPGWELLAAHPPQYMLGPGVAMVLPTTSRMAQRWGPGIMDALNHTSLGLVEVS